MINGWLSFKRLRDLFDSIGFGQIKQISVMAECRDVKQALTLDFY